MTENDIRRINFSMYVDPIVHIYVCVYHFINITYIVYCVQTLLIHRESTGALALAELQCDVQFISGERDTFVEEGSARGTARNGCPPST